MVNWEYYKVFYYVAAAGSVSEAARQLNLSQPAVSQSIRNLEGTLGNNSGSLREQMLRDIERQLEKTWSK